jgi:DNA-binding transcriptional ArsR family regulator
MMNIAEKTIDNLLGFDVLERAAECLRTIAHPARLRIIQILLQQPRSVGELADACGVASHIMSEHLRILKDRGFLASERRGRKIYYSIAEPCLKDIMKCVAKYGS